MNRLAKALSIIKKIYFKIKFGKRIVIGKNVVFGRGISIRIGKHGRLIIGDYVFFNRFCSINCHSSINIGNLNIFGEFVTLYDHNHSFNTKHNQFCSFSEGKIIIGESNWFCSKCSILKDTIIGSNNVFGTSLIIDGEYKEEGFLYKSDNSITKEKIRFIDEP